MLRAHRSISTCFLDTQPILYFDFLTTYYPSKEQDTYVLLYPTLLVLPSLCSAESPPVQQCLCCAVSVVGVAVAEVLVFLIGTLLRRSTS